MITVLNQNLMSGLTQSERLVAEYEVTGSAVTTVTFEGLDLVGDGGVWEIALEVVSASATGYLLLYVNGDTTDGNYSQRYIDSDGPSLTTNSWAYPRILQIVSGSYVAFSKVNLAVVNSHVVFNASTQFKNTLDAMLLYGYKSTTDTNITRLDFTSTVASGIGIGSKISIYRKH